MSQILPVPRGRPRGDRALADRERVVGDHRLFGDFVHASEPVARRAGALHRVRREVLGVEHRLLRRIAAGARVQHAHEAGKRRDASHRRARARRAALLLKRDGGRQSFDRIEFGHADLVDQAARVRRDRLEVAPLRLGVQRAECERRLAGAGHAREHDEGVARDVEVDVFQVVLARTAHAHVACLDGLFTGWVAHAPIPARARPAVGALAHHRGINQGINKRARNSENRS